MNHRVMIGGVQKDLDIRAMDESFIVYCKLLDAPLTRQSVGVPEQETDAYVVQDFFRKQIRVVGSCMILAWDGDGVIGKMHFTTREMHEATGGPENWDARYCYCVDHDGFAPKLQTFRDEELDRLLKSESRTLRVLCFNVGHTDPRWHGQGVAKAMLEYLKQWARERGWRRIEARSCPDITPTMVIGDWMLRRGAFGRRGFRVAEEWRVSPEEAARRLQIIEESLAGTKKFPAWADWYLANAHRLAADPTLRAQYDKDYLMVCNL